MANFNNNRGNNRFGGGDRPKSGDNRFDRSNFANTLYQATCAECHKMCEVPFRPTNGRPVYCKDCFDKKGGNAGGDRNRDRFSPRDYNFRAPAKPQFDNTRTNHDVVVRQLEAVNAKLEQLIQILTKRELKDVVAGVSKKRSKKTVVKNKQ